MFCIRQGSQLAGTICHSSIFNDRIHVYLVSSGYLSYGPLRWTLVPNGGLFFKISDNHSCHLKMGLPPIPGTTDITVSACAFQQHANCILKSMITITFSLPSVILVCLKGNRSSHQQVQKVTSKGCNQQTEIFHSFFKVH